MHFFKIGLKRGLYRFYMDNIYLNIVYINKNVINQCFDKSQSKPTSNVCAIVSRL